MNVAGLGLDINITDNDIAGVTFNPAATTRNVSEGGSFIIDVKLDTEPGPGVSMTFAPDNTDLTIIGSPCRLTPRTGARKRPSR